tara:strand:+ start:4605 stop:5207 length:603 start_codon:yes stop_codon:yes gene_type:complete
MMNHKQDASNETDRAPADTGVYRRVHERTPLRLHGSYQLTTDADERALIVADVSPGGARLIAEDIPTIDSEITMKIASLGSLNGRVVRTASEEFAVLFTHGSAERQRMAASIAWNYNKSRLGLANRRSTGSEAVDSCDPIEFSDGSKADAEITEFSLSGVSFRCARPVEIGEQVHIGALTGSVVKLIDGGFAVAFDPPDA